MTLSSSSSPPPPPACVRIARVVRLLLRDVIVPSVCLSLSLSRARALSLSLLFCLSPCFDAASDNACLPSEAHEYDQPRGAARGDEDGDRGRGGGLLGDGQSRTIPFVVVLVLLVVVVLFFFVSVVICDTSFLVVRVFCP